MNAGLAGFHCISFRCPFWTQRQPRCVPLPTTLLFNVPSIRPGFLGNLRLVAGWLGRCRLVLHRRAPLVLLVLLRNSPRLLPLLASLARRGRAARIRLPFPLPLEAPAALEEKVKEPERSQPDGTSLPLRVGGCLAPHWRRWQAIGAESWVVTVLRDGYRVPFTDSPPPLSDVPGSLSSGSSLAGGDARQRSLRNRPRSGSCLLQSSLPGGEGIWRLTARDLSLSPERVRPA